MSAELKYIRKVLIFLIGFIILSCNEYSSILPSSGVYKVTVYVDNTPLEVSGFIDSQKKLQPAFLTSVAGDPDVQGLSVVIKDMQDEVQSTELMYSKTSLDTTTPLDTTAARILVPSLDGTLPEFSLPSALPIGPHKLILRVLGYDTVLSEKEIPFYYLSDAVLSIKEIQSYPPGYKPSVSAPLFPPKIKLFIEGTVVSDTRLDPYIIWYEGNRVIKEGRLAEQANRFLWETPLSEGFQTIRCEVYPENPNAGKKGLKIPSISATFRIAISKTAPIPGTDFNNDNYSFWYHFLGNLNSEGDAGGQHVMVSKKSQSQPLWLPGDDSYGLAVGEAHQYYVEYPLLPPVEERISDGTLLLRFAPSVEDADGTVFYANFNNQNNMDEPLSIRLNLVSGTVKLQAEIGDYSVQSDMIPQKLPAKSFYNIKLNIKQVEKALLLSIPESPTPLLTIDLPESFSYSGSGSYGFGESKKNYAEVTTVSTPVPEEALQEDTEIAVPTAAIESENNLISAIIDELGIKVVEREDGEQQQSPSQHSQPDGSE